MEFHSLANIFPLMSDCELDVLAADIAVHGLREPIHTYQGRILDGRNRFNACRKAGVEPCFVPWEGKGDPVAFVVSMNLHRRHLNESQRADIAAKLTTLARGGDRRSDQSANLRFENDKHDVSVEQAAELLNVSERSVDSARRVRQHGHEALVAAVEAGQVSVSDAAKVARKPKDVQQAAIDAVANGRAKTAAEAAHRLQRNGLPPDTPPAETDALGITVPEAYLAVFATRCEFQAAARKLDEARRAVEELAESPAGFYLRKELQHLAGKFKEIKYVVTHTAPHTVAPAKRNEPKWVSEIVWRTLSDEERGQASRPAARVPRH
ncbi:MAG TPA: hypothetical protein VND64_33770 [Pirellulales bacterium]|nr:hypothetical protein [Pirellulales bacterium]